MSLKQAIRTQRGQIPNGVQKVWIQQKSRHITLPGLARFLNNPDLNQEAIRGASKKWHGGDIWMTMLVGTWHWSRSMLSVVPRSRLALPTFQVTACGPGYARRCRTWEESPNTSPLGSANQHHTLQAKRLILDASAARLWFLPKFSGKTSVPTNGSSRGNGSSCRLAHIDYWTCFPIT